MPRRTWLVGLGLLVLVGCSDGTATSPGTKPETTASPEIGLPPDADPPKSGASKVELQRKRFQEVEAAIAAQKGKILVVDFWATWCAPCKKEFPHLVELQHKYQGRDLVCMSITLDEADQHAAAEKFLREKNATFTNFLIDEQSPAWQKKWGVESIPVVLVYGKDGKLAKRFDMSDPDDQLDYAKVDKLVGELLAK